MAKSLMSHWIYALTRQFQIILSNTDDDDCLNLWGIIFMTLVW